MMLFILLTAPLLMAPGSDPCPTCGVIQEFYAALEAKDVDKAMFYIAEDAVLWRGDKVAYRGKDEIKEQLKREIKLYRFKVDYITADREAVSYAWTVISDSDVWTGTDTAIVENGQILMSKMTIP